jgi:hypothetical protein
MQTSLWLNIFGFIPPPYFLIPVIVYWTLYRSKFEAVFMTYLISISIIGFSSVTLFMNFIGHLCVFGTSYSLKDRVLWSGPNSFMLGCLISAFALQPITFIVSQFFELNPMAEFLFWDWLIRSLLTALVSYPLFFIFSACDKWTQKEPPRDTESEVL